MEGGGKREEGEEELKVEKLKWMQGSLRKGPDLLVFVKLQPKPKT